MFDPIKKEKASAQQQAILRTGRRGFLRLAAGGGVAAAAVIAAGCDSDDPISGGGNGDGNGGGGGGSTTVTFDFSSDTGVLNYAYALEQLEAAFYAQVVAALDAGNLSFDDDVAESYFRDLAVHEDNHRLLFQQALGNNAIAGLTPNFTGVDFTSASSVLATAQTLEDTGVAAYNGAGRYLTNDDFLTLAGKIVSVEARHAAAVRAINSNSAQAFADLSTLIDFGANTDFALDAALAPGAVVTAANGFVMEDLMVTGL